MAFVGYCNAVRLNHGKGLKQWEKRGQEKKGKRIKNNKNKKLEFSLKFRRCIISPKKRPPKNHLIFIYKILDAREKKNPPN
jgi:hypothetical protein